MMRPSVSAGIAVLAALGTFVATAAAAAPAVTPQYAALGDSYASGVGSRTYYSDSGSCYRSPYAYAVLDAARVGAALTFNACSGAKAADVQNKQLAGLTTSTRWVTVQAGGDDLNFSSVITTCAEPSWLGDCDKAVANAQSIARNTLPGRLDALYNAIRSHATKAKVTVVGYPRLFNGVDCNAATWFSAHDESILNQTADLLDSTMAGRASAHGFAFVNPEQAFIGHAVCDKVEWINGLSNPVRESYHPNRSGQSAYANLVDADLV
ncbi:MAG TPA: SGNH/GDSL hydrolase family protein [Jatrophihabitantaceae bacterium]|nr:SGNH/GDSL hydrolase family protein [Jatrophihabitantaceae bacterium]